MTNGILTINGITDRELVKVIDAKIRHEGQLGFNPQNMQTANVGGKTAYNNVALLWTGEAGLTVVLELLTELEGHHHLRPKEEVA